MSFVVDASVALKWVLAEDGSDRARALLASETLLAPDLFWIECANVLLVKARRGALSAVDARDALAAIEAAPVSVIASRSLVHDAQRLAMELDHATYDCLYLAAALQERTHMITADEAFVRAVSRVPAYAQVVRLI